MAQILADIAQKLSRLFLGRIRVRSLDPFHEREATVIHTHRRPLEIMRMRADPRVGSACFVAWKNQKARSAGSLLGKLGEIKTKQISLALKGGNVKAIPLNQQEGKVKKISLKLQRAKRVRHGLMRIANFPIYRKNRLNFIKNPPKIEKATILALFSPIFRDSVIKTVLDKSSGNLLVWYERKRVSGEPQHLLLVRVFGAKEPLEWIWLPAAKKQF
ncbi:MAG: hypothetical protein KBH12_05020 [Synergistaceae bacterium]|nr:hypothetical protein [Synergistaceae bacterium]